MYWSDTKVQSFQELPEETRNALLKQYPRKSIPQCADISHTSSFAKVIEKAQDFADKWKVSLDKVMMEHQYTEDYGSYSSEVHLETQGLETDEQYHSRLWENHERDSWRNELDRKEYERLKAKFK